MRVLGVVLGEQIPANFSLMSSYILLYEARISVLIIKEFLKFLTDLVAV